MVTRQLQVSVSSERYLQRSNWKWAHVAVICSTLCYYLMQNDATHRKEDCQWKPTSDGRAETKSTFLCYRSSGQSTDNAYQVALLSLTNQACSSAISVLVFTQILSSDPKKYLARNVRHEQLFNCSVICTLFKITFLGKWDERGERPFLCPLASLSDRHTFCAFSPVLSLLLWTVLLGPHQDLCFGWN